jgi:hypothetical protein
MTTKVQIVDVVSAAYTASPSLIDLVATIEGSKGDVSYAAGTDAAVYASGNIWRAEVAYTWAVDEDYDNSWNVAAWFAAHPDFEIEPYAPPVPSTDPNDYPLTMRQLRLGLVLNGFPVDFIKTAIIAISDEMQRAIATIWYEETSTNIQWSHPMTQQLIASAGISAEKAAAMWMQAKDLDA